MKKNACITALAFTSYFMTAQSISSANNTVLNSFSKEEQLKTILSGSPGRNISEYDNRYEGVKGSPFLFDNWLSGKLMLSDSLELNDQSQYKFDAYNNEVWIKLMSGKERILYSNELLALEINKPNGTKAILKKSKLPESNDRNYFTLVIYEGQKVRLVKDVKKTLRRKLSDAGATMCWR